jgi:hypothetical protein
MIEPHSDIKTTATLKQKTAQPSTRLSKDYSLFGSVSLFSINYYHKKSFKINGSNESKSRSVQQNIFKNDGIKL